MTGEVQPVCARCGHTPLEHSAGPCHQRSAAGVGCDCGGWDDGHAPEPPCLRCGHPGDRHDRDGGKCCRCPCGGWLDPDPIDTDTVRLLAMNPDADRDELGGWMIEVADEVDRLQVEVDALADALADIADGECLCMDDVCWVVHPDDPDEWCSTCVAEIAWCAWKMGTLA